VEVETPGVLTMKALIIGFGAMGCRHAQSLLASKQYERIEVVEPSDGRLAEGLQKIGATPNAVIRVPSLAEASPANIVIVATSSEPRFAIIRELLERGFKRFLVEKIVFQSAAQFDEIIDLLERSGAQAYCNFANRYYPTYIRLHDDARTSSAVLSMTVTGGDIGIGCNAIHYLDLFEYIAGIEITTMHSSLSPSDKKNKRGEHYREFSGLITAESNRGDILTIYFDPSHSGGATLNLEIGETRHVISEGTALHYCISRGVTSTVEFPIIPTSRLTATIVDDILGVRSPLTTIAQTRNAHVHLFKEINRTLQLPDQDSTLCPIT